MHFRYKVDMFDLLVNPTSKIIHTSPAVLRRPGNVQVVVEILFLSYAQTEIHDIACSLRPVNVGHVWFISHPEPAR